MKKVQGAMAPGLPGKQDAAVRDAASALVSLGFAETASYDAVKTAARGLTSPSVQEIIKAALRLLKEAERR